MHRPSFLACTAFILGLAAAAPAEAEVATELLAHDPDKPKTEAMAMQEPQATESPRAAETCMAPRALATTPVEATKDRPRQSLQQALRSGH